MLFFLLVSLNEVRPLQTFVFFNVMSDGSIFKYLNSVGSTRGEIIIKVHIVRRKSVGVT